MQKQEFIANKGLGKDWAELGHGLGQGLGWAWAWAWARPGLGWVRDSNLRVNKGGPGLGWGPEKGRGLHEGSTVGHGQRALTRSAGRPQKGAKGRFGRSVRDLFQLSLAMLGVF